MSEQKDAVNLEKLEGNGFTRNKWLIALVIILLLAVAASVTALVLLGLILSPWLSIPCFLFVAAICLVGKVFYDEHQLKLNGNTFSTQSVNFTSDEEIENTLTYDLSNHSDRLPNQVSSVVNSIRSNIFENDHLPESTQHLNLVLIGKPEVMSIAKQMFCKFAPKSEDTVNDLCILNDFSFDEATTISLFEVKSADDMAG